jgi:hypothetical protein
VAEVRQLLSRAGALPAAGDELAEAAADPKPVAGGPIRLSVAERQWPELVGSGGGEPLPLAAAVAGAGGRRLLPDTLLWATAAAERALDASVNLAAHRLQLLKALAAAARQQAVARRVSLSPRLVAALLAKVSAPDLPEHALEQLVTCLRDRWVSLQRGRLFPEPPAAPTAAAAAFNPASPTGFGSGFGVGVGGGFGAGVGEVTPPTMVRRPAFSGRSPPGPAFGLPATRAPAVLERASLEAALGKCLVPAFDLVASSEEPTQLRADAATALRHLLAHVAELLATAAVAEAHERGRGGPPGQREAASTGPSSEQGGYGSGGVGLGGGVVLLEDDVANAVHTVYGARGLGDLVGMTLESINERKIQGYTSSQRRSALQFSMFIFLKKYALLSVAVC